MNTKVLTIITVLFFSLNHIVHAQNVDKIINHFYEQGKTDGIKTVVEGSKNPSADGPRPTAGGDQFIGGFKVKALDGVSTSKLRINKSKFN